MAQVALKGSILVRDEEENSVGGWPWWRWVLTGLSTLSLALSAYLSWHYLAGTSVIGCGGGNACDELLSSRWSTIGGVLPVSGLSAGVYLAILVASFFVGPTTTAPERRLAWCAMLVLVGAVGGAAVWFTIVQKWVIGDFCPYCMATHVAGLVLATFIIWRARMQFDDCPGGLRKTAPAQVFGDSAAGAPDGSIAAVIGAQAEHVHLLARRRSVWRWFAVGIFLAGIVAVCQIALPPSAVYRGGDSQANGPAIDPRTVPLVGSPDATYLVTLLFDYKCPHCQQMHFLLDQAIRRHRGKLAFALCPTPLDRQCNPYISSEVNEFKDSCELAKVALAVWLANREAFAAFDRWMFSLESGDRWRPRSLDAARVKAVELVGQAKFDVACADPWIDRYLRTSIQIWGDTLRDGQSGSGLPKLVFGSRWASPQASDAEGLISILHDSLAVPEP